MKIGQTRGQGASIHRKAAALVESLARNHGFIDGNKRTAFLVVDEPTGESFIELEKLIVKIADDVHPPFEEIVDWFRVQLEKP